MTIEQTPLNTFTGYVGIKFDSTPREYFFGIKANQKLEVGNPVVVETVRGMELGLVTSGPFDIALYKSELGLKPVLRKATDIDIKTNAMNKEDAKIALAICQKEIQNLKLDMHLISCEYTLDRSKVQFSYLADERVDFRELLKVLASKLHTRIELRQVGTRDKAKMVGGIGVCGLPLCCSSFLNEFDGISISRAKNQMLAINIPKLSGHCGKLICCLKFEDDTYTLEKEKFPELGSKVFIDKIEYTVTSINVISTIVKVENAEDVKYLPLEELKKQATYRKKKDKRNDEKK